MVTQRDPTITRIRGKDLIAQTAQTAGALRLTGVGEQVGAARIWMGRVKNQPGEWSSAHHHGDAETAGFLLAGHARIYFGDDYRQYIDLEPGDFVHVPPLLPHIEGNLSETEPMEWLTARTPDNIVVNLDQDGRQIHDRTLAVVRPDAGANPR
jgi:uncharacterized RmlC-like cupin family protein